MLYPLIKEYSTAFSVVSASHEEIDKHNILKASLFAMKNAVYNLNVDWKLCLIDGNLFIPEIDKKKQIPVIKGDSKSACIAAASILAKVDRDEWMTNADKLYPEYQFAKHKGYGTELHRSLLKKHGPCPIHRMSFCKNILEGKI